MITSSNGNIFRVTGPLCREFTGSWWTPHQWCRALMFSLICARMNGWVNNCEAGDLRPHHAHYAVVVMDSSTASHPTILHKFVPVPVQRYLMSAKIMLCYLGFFSVLHELQNLYFKLFYHSEICQVPVKFHNSLMIYTASFMTLRFQKGLMMRCLIR